MKIQSLFIVICVSVTVIAHSLCAGQLGRPAVDVDPISAIIGAFHSHSVVALDEGNHRNNQGHSFRLSLVRDPRFAAIVNDIVVEFGNARYQDLMDRFIRGEDVPDVDLAQVWQNTTQPTDIWDAPIYEEFFRAVRGVNVSLPPERQLRVLLGDPPIDWNKMHKPEDCRTDSDSYSVEVIRKEVLAKQRRALIIYGGMHFLRQDPFFSNTLQTNESSIVNQLEKQSNTKVFTIWTYTYGGDIKTLQPEIASWPQPSLTVLSGTTLGVEDFAFYYPHEITIMEKGKTSCLKARPGLRMEDEFDALLYLGPTQAITYSELPAELCRDPVYRTMRERRLSLIGEIFGDFTSLDEFKHYCKSKCEPENTSEND